MAVTCRDFLCYDITTSVNMNLGERVRVDGRLLSVSRREAELKEGRVLFTYRLAGKGYSCVAPHDGEPDVLHAGGLWERHEHRDHGAAAGVDESL